MKVYLYFLIDKKIIKKMAGSYLLESLSMFQYPDSEDYFFYAYTHKKKVAKKFEEMRDMSKFFKKEIELDEDELKDLDSKFYSFSALTFQSLLCGTNSHIVVPVTTGEYWYCVEAKAESMNQYFDTMKKLDPVIFTDKMIELLGQLDYMNCFSEFQSYREFQGPVVDYIRNNAWENELGIFLFLYSYLLIPEKVLSEGYYE